MGTGPEARFSLPWSPLTLADSVEDDFELSTVCHRPEGLEQLQEQTKFTRKELQVLYRGFKNVSARPAKLGEGWDRRGGAYPGLLGKVAWLWGVRGKGRRKENPLLLPSQAELLAGVLACLRWADQTVRLVLCFYFILFVSWEKSCLPLEKLHAEPLGDMKILSLPGNLWAWRRAGSGRRASRRGFVSVFSLVSPLPRNVPAELSVRRTSSRFTPSSFLKEVRGQACKETAVHL